MTLQRIKAAFIKDGQLIWVLENVSVVWFRDESSLIRNDASQPLFIQGVMLNITERKRLEAQLLQAQKLESIGRLAGGIAHDFNNVLTAIGGYAELITASLPADDPLRADSENILQATRRASDLTRQLLAFARKQIIDPQVLNLNELINNLNTLLHRIIGEDIELIIQLAPDLAQVKADPGQIEQVLINLAANARDAMLHSGKLIVATHNVIFDDVSVQQPSRSVLQPPGITRLFAPPHVPTPSD
jgi:two-component system, cell cycle sensor histidine kinase and response regulator CckA